ncbi:hypothetical protein [Dokdonia sp.]|uniref:hypothetical protein n=1 Tax=Dokdonia sp. TaxID=2024995 RepID=UPI0032663BB5
MNAIYIFFIGHIAYEGIYRKNKIDSKRKEVKSRHLNELKSNLSNFTPKIATGKLPSGLTKFIPIIKKWGVDNKILREDLYENSENNELLILKSIESKRDVLEEWINENPEEQNTIKAINLTLKSYDDLGLWTWKSK